jgi:mono/diheme cytochrome c family protein
MSLKLRLIAFASVLAILSLVGVLSLFAGATPASTRGLSPADLSATALCVELTANSVAMYALFGTPTPNPNATPTPQQPKGDPILGQLVFNGVGACHVCHEVDSMEELIAPSLMHLASTAGGRVEGVSAEYYIRGAILRPSERIVPSVKPGIMPTTYEQSLTQAQLNDLVAYLMTLE